MWYSRVLCNVEEKKAMSSLFLTRCVCALILFTIYLICWFVCCYFSFSVVILVSLHFDAIQFFNFLLSFFASVFTSSSSFPLSFVCLYCWCCCCTLVNKVIQWITTMQKMVFSCKMCIMSTSISHRELESLREKRLDPKK